MDLIISFISAIIAIFGWYEEEVLTTQQCLEMQSHGYVVYQLGEEEMARMEKCREMLHEAK